MTPPVPTIKTKYVEVDVKYSIVYYSTVTKFSVTTNRSRDKTRTGSVKPSISGNATPERPVHVSWVNLSALSGPYVHTICDKLDLLLLNISRTGKERIIKKEKTIRSMYWNSTLFIDSRHNRKRHTPWVPRLTL